MLFSFRAMAMKEFFRSTYEIGKDERSSTEGRRYDDT
jgi:hypothetical protein